MSWRRTYRIELSVDTEGFLRALFPDLTGGLCCELRVIKDGQVRRREWPTCVDEIVINSGVLKEGADVYFGPAARRGHDGTRAGVAYAAALWVDLDKEPEEAGHILGDFELPPSAVVNSGRHVHLYWLLREPYILDGPEDIAQVEGRLRGLARRLGGDACWDVAHVLRVPGTVNHKNGEERPVKLLEYHPERLYNLSDFDAWALEAPANGEVGFTDGDVDAATVLQRVMASGISDETLAMITEGTIPEGKSRSERDLSVISRLLQDVPDLSDDDVRALFGAHPVGDKYIEKGHHGDAYLATTIAKARAPQVEIPMFFGSERQGSGPALPPQEEVEALPPACLRGTFGRYVALWADYEGSDAFDFVSLLTAYGVRLGRTVFTPYDRPLFPNFYTVLYGPTATSKKSSAFGRAIDLLVCAEPTVHRVGGLLSAEGLLQMLGYDPTDKNTVPIHRQKAIIGVEEFRSLLNKARQEGAGLIPFLTELWDCREEYRITVRHNPALAIMPTVGLLAASTPEWLEQALQDSDTYGGYTNRHLFITGPLRPLQPFPPERDPAQWNAIVKRLVDAPKQYSGDTIIRLSQGAGPIWDKFYREFGGQTWASEAVAKVVQRVPSYVLKVALLYAVDEGTPSITAEQMEAAIAFGRFASRSAASLFVDISGDRVDRLENLIWKHLLPGGPSRRELYQRVSGRFHSEEFNRTLDSMVKTGRVAFRDGGYWRVEG